MKFFTLMSLLCSYVFASTYEVKDGHKMYKFLVNENHYSLISKEFDLSFSSKCIFSSMENFNTQLEKAKGKLIEYNSNRDFIQINVDKKAMMASKGGEAANFFRELPYVFIKLKALEKLKCKN